MPRFIIDGSHPLTGTHRVPGNKNAALPMIAAALLTPEPVTLRNLPWIADVHTMLTALRELGAEVEIDTPGRSVRITSSRLSPKGKISKATCQRIRTSILFAAPLLHRLRTVTLHPPGGDVIGRRRVDTHFNGLHALGATIGGGATYRFKAPPGGLTAASFLLDEASVTATENLVMAAACAKGQTTLYNTACEPHVCDLCAMLNAMGAHIQGIGTNRLQIRGVPELRGVDTTIGPDYIDAASYITAATVTGGSLTLTHISPSDFPIFEHAFRIFGVKWKLDGTTLRLDRQPNRKTAYDFGQAIPQISDGPWPAIPSDLMSVLIVLATQTRGTALFFEKMFESRMYFVDHLIGMGARIVQCDPHRVVVTGATTLQGGTVISPDIRAGMALLIAALCSKGKTVIANAQSIDRGYENVDEELRRLGARIERVHD